jgi:hypothetical protein
MTKYKTISLSYGNGESELINGMSGYNWGLINVKKPDYNTGDVNFYYTFAGGDNAVDVDFSFYSNPKFRENRPEARICEK